MNDINNVKNTFLDFIKNKFELQSDQASQAEVVENINRGVEFKGTNLWILIFATFIASIGLNVNSTAVIIGAMLISPLMGPIMGFGLALGISDFELMKRSLRNFLFAVAISLIVSAIYFYITPLSVAQSELEARSTPSSWDVMIALFGGLAGIVAQSRKDRTSTVIPGVAIATALMPPLCTAGYGIATLNLRFLIGALYLFLINAVFISLATFLIVRFLKYEKKQFLNPKAERKVRHIILATITIMIVPSVILGYDIADRTMFDANAKKYVEQSFVFKSSEVADIKTNYTKKKKSIEVFMLGDNLSADAISALENQMANFNLKNTELIIKQQGAASSSFSLETIDKLYESSNKLITERENRIKELEAKLNKYSGNIPTDQLINVFKSLSNTNISVGLSRTPIYNLQGEAIDTMTLCLIKSQTETAAVITDEERSFITKWIKSSTKTNEVKIIIE